MFIPPDTRAALGNRPHGNRSLYFDRFANPRLHEDQRRDWFKTGCSISVAENASKRQRDTFYPRGTHFLHAQLKARLMLNMAGGVMENAGLCLDRFGTPYIPGSAVKGCARRAALYALHAWTQEGHKPGPGDACHGATEMFESRGAMLHQIARVFGWGETEWTDEKSDFLWALHGDSRMLKTAFEQPGIDGHRHHSGTIAFFPAHPNADPGLELDILTSHHLQYYGNPETQFAADTEEPNPVFFPAVRAQAGDDHFTFALCALRSHSEAALHAAKAWLTLGLEIFGLGAKTAAGYGWFDATETDKRVVILKKNAREAEVHRKAAQRQEIRHDLHTKLRKLTPAEKKPLLAAADTPEALLGILRELFPGADKTPRGHWTAQGYDWFADFESENSASEALLEFMEELREELESADLSGPQQEDRKLARLTEQQFAQKVADFCQTRREEQEAVVRALRESRSSAWEELKKKVEQKPKKYTQTADAIRRLCREMNLGKMP